MTMVQIVCEKCGFSTEKPADSLPKRRVMATCPECRHVFPFDPVSAAQRISPAASPQFNAPRPPRFSLLGRADAGANKAFFLLFLLLVLAAVGVRLWANHRELNAPYPTLLAASADGVAVIAGESIYLFDTAGNLQRSYPVPKGVWPTQLFWDRGTLCLADLESKKTWTYGGSSDVRGFSGLTLASHFKVAREPATGRLFVTDSHRVVVCDESGHFLHAFGREGTGPGEFKFPNGLAFDEAGQLLVANTKRPSIDLYTADGRYLQTVVTPAGDPVYRYPTHVVVTPEQLLLLEQDGFLQRGKVRSYDRSGKWRGELPLGKIDSIGDLVASGERLYLSDRDNRQLLVYALPELRPLGPFSPEFASMCARWTEEAAFYHRLSSGALLALLALCGPVIYFFVRIKRSEARQVSRVDLGRVSNGVGNSANSDLILGVAVNKSMQRVSMVLLGVSVSAIVLFAVLMQLETPVAFGLTVMVLGMLALVAAVICMIKAGGIGDLKRRQTETLFKRLIFDGKLPMQAGEQVERVALAQQSSSAQDLVLLVFTNRRLLSFTLSWNRVARIEQIPYAALLQVQAPAGRLLQVVQCLQVTVQVEGVSRQLKYYAPTSAFLTQLSEEFTRRIGQPGGLQYADLCLTCYAPLQGDLCAHCATHLQPDRHAMWLSLLCPGLGQLRNGEMQKGLVFLAITMGMLMLGYVGIRGWFFEGADISPKEKLQIAVMIAMAPVWYVANVVDAYRSSIRGRKPE